MIPTHLAASLLTLTILAILSSGMVVIIRAILFGGISGFSLSGAFGHAWSNLLCLLVVSKFFYGWYLATIRLVSLRCLCGLYLWSWRRLA